MKLNLLAAAWAFGLATTAFAATDYPSGYTKCAQVGSACAMTGTHSVALGKSGSFVYATLTGNFTCQTSLFPSNNFTTSAWCSVGPSSTSSSAASSSVASSASSSKSSSSSSKASSSAASSVASSSGFWALTGDLGAHDPTLTKEGSVWYEFHTGTGIQGKRSNDGKAWSAIPQIFLSAPSWWKTYVPAHSGLDVWAPDVSTYNGRVYMYYAISTFGSNVSAIGLVSAATIGAGSWRDDGLVIRSTASNNYNAIDPNLSIDKDGNPWLVFGSFWNGIQLTQLDKSTMKPTGSLTTLATRSGGIEAPVIVYHNGYYYLFVSIDKCCQGVNSTYKIAYGRSTSITGPYVDKNGNKMTAGNATVMDAGNAQWVGPGGQDIYGTSVIIRHAYDATDNGNPKMLINDLNWDSSGWPTY